MNDSGLTLSQAITRGILNIGGTAKMNQIIAEVELALPGKYYAIEIRNHISTMIAVGELKMMPDMRITFWDQ